MNNLPDKYKKLIAKGINSSSNLRDLNDMTDRGPFPLKPWTAQKTVGTIKMINDYNIRDEESFVVKFEQLSKIGLVDLTKQVYEHQLKYFKKYKYDIDTIFKYTYCCIVVNSLKGNSTEKAFDLWAKNNEIKIKTPPAILDQKYHTDRLELNNNNTIKSFISIKPNSFSNNYIQYTDVFCALELLSSITNIEWKIFFRNNVGFSIITRDSLSKREKDKIKENGFKYSKFEKMELESIINSM